MSLTALLFFALFAGTLLLAVLRHPIYGLYAYLLAFYGYPPGRWWGGDLPDLRWSLIAAAATLIGVIRLGPDKTRPAWYSNSVAVLLIVFTLWLWLQSIWALSPADHAYFVSMYTKYVVLVFLMYRLLDSEEAIMQFSIAHVIGCAYYGWIAYHTAGPGRYELVGGPNMDGASAFSVQMSTGLIFAGILLFRVRGVLRAVVLLAAPFILNAIILTQSRGGFLGLVCGGLAVMYLAPLTKRRTFYAAGMLSVVLIGILAHDAFWQRMETIVQAVEKEEMDGSAESRWLLIDAQWEMFKLNPVIGSGHRGTVVLSPNYLDDRWLSHGGRSSHNTFMTLLVEQGIIGTVVYSMIVIWAISRLLQLKRTDRQGMPDAFGLYRAGIGGALTCVFVAGQFADLLRLEVVIWCLVLLVVVSQFAHSDRAMESETKKQRRDEKADVPQERLGA